MKIEVFHGSLHPAWHMVIRASYKTGASLGQSRLSLRYYIRLAVARPIVGLVLWKPEQIYFTNSPLRYTVRSQQKQIMMLCD